jgi:two-component system copper resistance phosphate regulon response regulator CusR
MCARKILIVDDEPLIQNLFDEAFSNAGYSVYLAADANEALGILKQGSIPLMIIDLALKSMNGFELCKNIRKDNPGAIIYALTGYFGYYNAQELFEAGFYGIFDKPIILKDLYQVVEDSFEKLDSSQNPSL